MQKAISSFAMRKQLMSKYHCHKLCNKLINIIIATLPAMQFATGGKRVYGGLKDQDRIFTNLYKDGDPFIDGALKRVSLHEFTYLVIVTG